MLFELLIGRYGSNLSLIAGRSESASKIQCSLEGIFDSGSRILISDLDKQTAKFDGWEEQGQHIKKDKKFFSAFMTTQCH